MAGADCAAIANLSACSTEKDAYLMRCQPLLTTLQP